MFGYKNLKSESMAIRPWSQLPDEVLETIYTLFKTNSPFDFLLFRAVCKTWRAAVAPPTLFVPRLPYPPSYLDQEGLLANFTFPLLEHTIYALQPHCQSSSPTWIVKLKDAGPDGLQFISQLSGSRIGFLPKPVLNGLDIKFKMSILCKEYHLDRVEFDSVLEKECPRKKMLLTCSGKLDTFHNDRFMVGKVVLYTNETTNVFVVMAIHLGGDLIFFRSGDEKWSTIEDLEYPCSDVIHYKGCFFAVEATGASYSIDPLTLKVTPVTHFEGNHYSSGGVKKRLVESKAELFLVDVDDSSEDLRWEVFKLDKENNEWAQVQSLEDQIFFLGTRCSFSISALNSLPGCKGNFILFTDSSVMRDIYGLRTYGNGVNQGIGVFNMEDGSCGRLEDHLIFSQLFWPPPTWITCSNSHYM